MPVKRFVSAAQYFVRVLAPGQRGDREEPIVFDGFCLEYKSDGSTLHLIEENYTSSSKAAFTWTQRKVIKQIKERKLFVKFHSICWTPEGWKIETI